VGKLLLTPWGLIAGLRLPRLRDVAKSQEAAFLDSERAESRLAELLLGSTLGGISYRKAVRRARLHQAERWALHLVRRWTHWAPESFQQF